MGFLAAGSNNITVFGGILTIIVFVCGYFLYQWIWGERDFAGIKRIIPMAIVYLAGACVNLLCVGNTKRMEVLSASKNSIFVTARNSFAMGAEFIQRHFNGVVLGYIILVGVILWWAIIKEEVLKDSKFSFPLPLLVTVISYCILSALYAPFAYLDNPELSELLINGNLEIHRVANTVYFAYVLFLLLNVFYYCGWLYKKGLKFYSAVVSTVVAVGAIVLMVISARTMILQQSDEFLTSAAVYNLKNGTAQYYGYQMATNFQVLEGDEKEVYVSPIAVDPSCLYPHDASDWKEQNCSLTKSRSSMIMSRMSFKSLFTNQ